MKKRTKKSSSATVMPTTIMQVVSVVVYGNLSGIRYSEGFNVLTEALFKPVETVKIEEKDASGKVTRINESVDHIQGVAPADGTKEFVVLVYVPTKNMFHVPCAIYLVNRQTRHLLDTGKISFQPDQQDGMMCYSIEGDEIPNWNVVAKVAASDLAEKAAMFDDPKYTTRSNSVCTNLKAATEVVEEEKVESLAIIGRLDTLDRLAERNPTFQEFVKKYCSNSFKPTMVSKGIHDYLKAEKIQRSIFHKRMNETSPIMFYHLLELEDLCDELKPLVDMTNEESHRTGKQKMSIEVASLLSRFDQHEQVTAWENVRVMETSHEMAREIRKLKPERQNHN